MKKLTYLLAILFFSGQIFGQGDNQTRIFGNIQSEGEGIPFAIIKVQGTNIVSSADATGHYKLMQMKEGKVTLTVQAPGYKPQTQSVTTEKGKGVELNFSLESDHIGLDEVVVSSDRDAVSQKKSGVIVSSIRPEVFSMSNALSLSEGLDFTPGLRMECNCQNCGFSQVRMNGLEGPYSQILINSRPIFSGLAGVYGLEMFPAGMVQKVEVVRGGGSALFGGNAVAGTINIITKEPSSNSFTVSLSATAVGVGHVPNNEIAYDKNLNFDASIVADNFKSGIAAYGTIRERDPYDDNGDSFSEEVLMKNKTLGLSTYYKPTRRLKLGMDMYGIHEFRRGGNQFDRLPHETDITEQLEHDIFGANLSGDWLTSKMNKVSMYVSGQVVDRDSYYGVEKDPAAYGKTTDFTSAAGLQYTGNYDILGKSKVVAGVDYNYAKLKDLKLGIEGAGNQLVSNQGKTVIGTFAQYDVTPVDWVKISAGVRYDNYNISHLEEQKEGEEVDPIKGGVFVPRINALFNILDEDLQFRVNYAKGYRAPQVFDEDLHIEMAGAKTLRHVNSEDLKQEDSHSFSGSFIYTNIFGSDLPIHTKFVVEGFYTKIMNPFASTLDTLNTADDKVFIRDNAESGAMVYGTNLEASAAFGKKVMLQAGFTIQKSLFEEAQEWGDDPAHTEKRFVRAPDNYGFLTVNYSPIKPLSFSLTGTYTGSMLVPHLGGVLTSQAELDAIDRTTEEGQAAYDEATLINYHINEGWIIEGERLEESKSFFNIGLKAAYTFNLKNAYKVKFSLGIQNMLDQTQHDHDKGVYRDASYIYGPHKSRTLFFGLEFGTGVK
ncbi:MAG: TonB-dependent receptor [Bacteroidia bacterium]|nr:MAG: TonB-dependent receptor [Bacteroidia bacterium]